jgi:hypothetical protein
MSPELLAELAQLESEPFEVLVDPPMPRPERTLETLVAGEASVVAENTSGIEVDIIPSCCCYWCEVTPPPCMAT